MIQHDCAVISSSTSNSGTCPGCFTKPYTSPVMVDIVKEQFVDEIDLPYWI